MAQSHETDNPIVTANTPLTDLLGAPLGPDWTVEGLAEQVLGFIAAQGSEEAQEFVLDADATTDRQSRRLLRPLLACLATKSAAEAGTPTGLYGGHFSFKRPGPKGPVWILGQFENRPGSVRVTLRRSTSQPKSPQDQPHFPATRATDAVQERDRVEHEAGVTWRREHLSCPTREQLGSYLLEVLDEETQKYVAFHLQTIGCPFCNANLEDLKSLQKESASKTQAKQDISSGSLEKRSS